jgi:hypothetical protein
MSPNCPFIRRQLSRYLDAELCDRRAAAVERHLANCRSCQRELDAYVAAARFVAAGREATPPADAWSHLEARLTERGVRGFSESGPRLRAAARIGERPFWNRRLAAAAVVVLAAGAVFAFPRLTDLFSPRAALAHEIAIDSFLAGYSEHRFDLEGEFATTYRVRVIDVEQARRLCPSGLPPAEELPAGYRLTRVMALSTDTCRGLVLEYHRGDRCLAVIQAPSGHPLAWGSIQHEPRSIGTALFEVHEATGSGGVLVHQGRLASLIVVGTCETPVLGEVASFLAGRLERAAITQSRLGLEE